MNLCLVYRCSLFRLLAMIMLRVGDCSTLIGSTEKISTSQPASLTQKCLFICVSTLDSYPMTLGGNLETGTGTELKKKKNIPHTHSSNRNLPLLVKEQAPTRHDCLSWNVPAPPPPQPSHIASMSFVYIYCTLHARQAKLSHRRPEQPWC